jgi:hypothetical protein
MVEPLRHRQTKGAETDMFDLQLPRHISTLPSMAPEIAPPAGGRHDGRRPGPATPLQWVCGARGRVSAPSTFCAILARTAAAHRACWIPKA